MPVAPFLRYRGPRRTFVHARQRSGPFTTTLRAGLVDQRKAGAKDRVDYLVVTKGQTGDLRTVRPEVRQAFGHGARALRGTVHPG